MLKDQVRNGQLIYSLHVDFPTRAQGFSQSISRKAESSYRAVNQPSRKNGYCEGGYIPYILQHYSQRH